MSLLCICNALVDLVDQLESLIRQLLNQACSIDFSFAISRFVRQTFQRKLNGVGRDSVKLVILVAQIVTEPWPGHANQS